MKLLLSIWRPLCHVQFWIMIAIYTVLGLSSNPGSMVPVFNDLLMHFWGYLVAGISISFAWPRAPYWQRAAFLLGYSIAIEIAQHFMPPRTFSGMDILANFSGILVGLGLFVLLKRIAPEWAKPFIR
ncbi:MAG: VanZ family protein [Cellvibrio sp.]|jgi:VanZ family protein